MTPAFSSDVFHHEVFELLAEPGCPLCALRATSEQRIVLHLTRDVTYEPGLLHELLDAGGLCYRHSRDFHESVAKTGSGGPLACVYLELLDRDLAWLGDLGDALTARRLSRRARSLARRSHDDCFVCRRLEAAERRHAEQLLEFLDDPSARERYADSEGLCLAHLSKLSGTDGATRAHQAAMRFLVDDGYQRLRELRRLLGEFDRKREASLADQRTEEEARSLTRVVKRYTGDRPRLAEIPWDPGLADW
jgi:hypothetical protein